ncbi:MAG: AmmeMemoRadiSam system radical SAM enzyme [Chloroflexota bacterium]
MAEERVKQALLYEPADGKLRCLTCERRCLVGEGEAGFCGTRRNDVGRLYSRIYGDISSISANPIEKKPLFHFHPGSRALTVGGWSCNFTCPWCQNYDISKSPENIGRGRFVDADSLVNLVGHMGCQGTSISFNEPTLLLEYSLDVFRLAREANYYNTYITNGYMTERALDLLIEHGLNAMNIDIKGPPEVVRRRCGAEANVVWRNAMRAKQKGVWVELTTLVIPGINDNEEDLRCIARRVFRELGADTPWHITGYYPAYRFAEDPYVPATPTSTLERGRDEAMAEGLRYVYAGNVPGHPYENTYCPRCGEVLIERKGYHILEKRIREDKCCGRCGEPIPIVGTLR